MKIRHLLPAALLAALALPAGAGTLRVVATTPDLADLAAAVGGDAVEVTSLAQGPQDVHFVEPRPSFVRALHRADALVLVGMDLEIGWLPALLRSARNPALAPGAPGHVDASAAIGEPLEVPSGRVDRSMGDVHPYGNPHYLTDPHNGLAVARLLRDRFAALAPDAKPSFDAGLAAFEARLGAALERWQAVAERAPSRLAVQDHRYWPYFARRFGLEIVATLEPMPGIAPTTAHLAQVIEQVRTRDVKLLLATRYFDARHARFVAAKTGVRVVPMAHQVGSRPGADDYVATIGHNVRQVFGP